MNDRIVRCGTL